MSLSRPPHRRKHSTAMNASSSSFSLKNPYEDVLLSRGGKVKFKPHEYAEIFSGSSSIPVLDVSSLGEPVRSGGCRSSELDYSNIFGGAKGDNVAVPYEQLFNGGVKKTERPPADAVFQEPISLNSVGEAKQSSGAFDHSTDGIKKQFNLSFNKTNQRSRDESNGETHVTQLHDIPGFTHFLDGTPQLQKKDGFKPVPPVKRDVTRTWSFSSGIEAITLKDELCPEKSYIPDKSSSVNEITFKSHIAKEASPLGRPSGLNDDEDIKQSNLPSSVSKETAGENSQPLFDEVLDENSDAAVSIAALKKAIEKAQESIGLAKMIMQKKKEGIKDVSKARRSKGRSKTKDKNENRTQHVPLGLEKNNMSEEFRQLDHAFPMFSGVDGKSAPTPSHSDNLLNAGKAKVETVRENFEAPNDHADGFIEVDMKFAPSCSQSKLLHTVKKVEVEKIRQNVTVVLESGKLDSNYNLICSKAKAMPCLEHMETNKGAVEQRELTMHQLNEVFRGRPESVANTSQSVQQLEKTSNEEAPEQSRATVDLIKVSVDLTEQLERVLKCSGSTQEQEKTTLEGGGNLWISQESEAPEVSDGIADFEKCAKKFVGQEDLCFFENLKVPSLEFNMLQNESQSLAKKNIMDHANIDKKPNNVPDWKDDGQDGKCSEDDESRMVLIEEILWFENELQLEGPLEEEMSEIDPGIFPGVGGVATEVDVVLEPEIDDNKLKFKHEEGNQTVPRVSEENEIAVRCMDAGEHEAVEILQTGPNNYPQDGNGEIPPDVEKISDTDRAAGVREEPESIFEFQDSSSEKDNFEDFDAHSKYSGTIFSDNHGVNTRTIFTEVPESCNVYIDNEAEKYQSVLRGSNKEEGSFSRENETLFAVEENEAGLRRYRSLKKSLEGQQNNTLDSKSSNADNEKTLPKDEDVLKTATEIHNTAQDHAANSSVNFFPVIHVSTSQVENLENINAKPDLQQNSENNKESRLSSSLENIDDVSAQESPACRANAVDTSHTTTDKEEVKGIVDLNSDEREDVGKQNECLNSDDQNHLSQTNCKPKERQKSVEAEREMKTGQDMEKNMENLDGTSTSQQQDTKGNEQKCDIDDQMQRIEAIKKGREREKDRIAVERAIREARERAFAEARERAERAAVERAAAEARQRVVKEVQEKAGKASLETKPSADKTSIEAKLRAERAAVERAIAEARERAREKATSQKTSEEARVQEWISNGSKNSNSSSGLEKSDGATSESAQRRKARLERHQRIMDRAGKALAEKNMRDLLAQKEQAERNRLAETLDADVKRWATGKQGNLRALLSTLQYILGPESGWQPVSLTEIVTTPAVKKAYRKATLCVHPDKLQQRGATIRQKYICEKIFDLLKAAWNRFNSEES